jgi:putative redox protein
LKIELKRIDSPFHFEAVNETGNIVSIDGSPSIGGAGLGARPMELLLMGLGSCSGIDIIIILNKQRQNVSDFQVSIEAERDSGKEANLFTKIHLHFNVFGEVEQEKLENAINLSLDKYCSVAKILEKSADIIYSFSINGEKIGK